MLIRDEEGVRWLPLGAVVAAVVVVGYVAYARWWPNDSAHEITVDEVLDRYRDDIGAAPALPLPPLTAALPPTTEAEPPPTTATAVVAPGSAVSSPTASSLPPQPPAEPVLPRPGVYRYATQGREHITALGGTEHVYPAETTVTVTPEGCGVRLRWDLLAERYEEWNLCVEDGVIVLQAASVQFHQFYGQAQTDAAECQASVALNPPPAAGTATARDCRLAGEPWNPVWTATGSGTARVGDATVATTTFDVTIDLDGDYPEHSLQRWALAPDGLPASIEFRMESSNPSPVGSVTYTEQVTATLLDLVPLQ